MKKGKALYNMIIKNKAKPKDIKREIYNVKEIKELLDKDISDKIILFSSVLSN